MPFSFGIKDFFDILIVSYILYVTLKLFKGTKTLYMLIGLGFIIVISGISVFVNLNALNWLISAFARYGLLALIVIFQPEIRRGLALLGKNPFFRGSFIGQSVIDEIVRAALQIRDRGLGALIVLERRIKLNDYIDEAGVPLKAKVNSSLIVSIFTPPSPLHDGAVIVRGDMIIAARVILPLAQSEDIDPALGTRHRAAMGITRITDAIVIIVSEERKSIRISEGGIISKPLTSDEFRAYLRRAMKLVGEDEDVEEK